ncbi:MAG: hypothetical protein ACRELB_26220, partial [Polyangiaceae bacterium]
MRGASLRRTLPALLVTAACHRGGTSASTAAEAGSDAAVMAAPSASPAIVASRCHATGDGLSLPSPEELELGDAQPSSEGWALGIVHRTRAGRVGAVAFIARDASSVHVVDLGPTLGDAPPPRVAARGSDLLVAAYSLPRKSNARELAVSVVSAGGAIRPVASLPQQRDDSFAFDLAPGLVVWDEATVGASPRGVIRIAELAADHAGAPRDVSPADSDAETPRVVATRDPGRSFVVWIARQPEPVRLVDAAAADEATGEARVPSWLEGVVVDAAGAPLGGVRKLTSQLGHVSAFDATFLTGEPRPTLLVVARDDGEADDGSGGSLLRVRLREDGIDAPLALPDEGLGRGAPTLIDAPSPWLSWVGPHEELRLLALDAAGAPAAPPSAEPALDDAC